MSDELLVSLRRAVEANPTDVALRVHLAELLVAAGKHDEAVRECGFALQHDPGNDAARRVMIAAMNAPTQQSAAQSPETPAEPPQPLPPTSETESDSTRSPGYEFDWDSAEEEFTDLRQPMFVDDAPDTPQDAWEVERPQVTLNDVGGLDEVKSRLEMSFLAPLRNPQMRELYGKSLRGGLLLYGPPGCGKTFIARAIAGEMGAQFMSIGITEVLDMWLGSSEKNLHALFQQARRNAPVVLFLDEIDALGAKRSTLQHNPGMRAVINQLLIELDGVSDSNEGLFVLGATNMPWDIDPALRRPGRFDRTVLVPPPDEPARGAIFKHHLSKRPIEGIDLARLAAHSDGLSGADIALACESAAELAMADSMRTGKVRMIQHADVERALGQVRPSTGDWFQIARNVIQFGHGTATYPDLAEWMKARRLL